MSQYGFFFDESRCIDCRACSIGCRDWNDVKQDDIKLLRVFTWEEGVFPELSMHTAFVPCYHCEKPACVEACSYGALIKEGQFGAVLVDQDACQGCQSCREACPYGTPQFSKRGAGQDPASKCTMCFDRLSNGDMPVCVNACPTRALDFGPLDAMKAKYGNCQALPKMPSPESTRPAVVFKTATVKQKLVAYDADKARLLFGKRGNKLDELYADSSAITEFEPSRIGRNELNLKASQVEDLMASRSDEW